MYYFFGGEYENITNHGKKIPLQEGEQETRPGYHFGMVHPCNDIPYVYGNEPDARNFWNVEKHHSHLYVVGDDLTVATLHVFSYEAEINAPTPVSLNERNQELLRRAVLLASYDSECPDCGEVIPSDVSEGDECKNCGHVFVLPRATDGTSE